MVEYQIFKANSFGKRALFFALNMHMKYSADLLLLLAIHAVLDMENYYYTYYCVQEFLVPFIL